MNRTLLLLATVALGARAGAAPGTVGETTALEGVRMTRTSTRGEASRPAPVVPAVRSIQEGSMLWSVLEPAATIDREGVAVSGDGQSLVAGWWLNDEYVAHYAMAGTGTPVWSYTLDPATGFFVPVDVGTTSAVIAGTSDVEPLRQWGPASSTPAFTHPFTPPFAGAHVAVAADGTFLVGASTDGTTPAGAVEAYDAVTGSQRWRVATLASGTQGLDVSRDGTRVAGNEYSRVNVWSASSGAPLAGFALPGGTQTISRLSGDGAYLVFGNFNGAVHLYRWDVPTTSYVSEWVYPTGDDWVTAVDVSDDGSTVAAGTFNLTAPYTGALHVIDRASGAPLWVDPTFGDYVQSVALSQDGGRIAAASWGGFQRTQGNVFAVYDRGSSTPVYGIADDSMAGVGSAFAASISDDGQMAGTGGKAIHARDFGSGGFLIAVNVPIVTPAISDVCPETLPRGAVSRRLVITGQNFDPAATVSVAPADVTLGAVAITPTLITALATVSPTATLGAHDVTVRNPDGRSGTAVAALSVFERDANLLTAPGAGPANAPQVRGYTSGGAPISGVSFFAYGSVGYGANVASADLDGAASAPGPAEILTGPGPGSIYGPQVRGFSRSGTPLAKVSYYAYGTLRFGVHVAGLEVDCDGLSEVLTGAGPGAVFGPHVRGWQYDNLAVAPMKNCSFYAYSTLKYGVHPEAGDMDRDALDELLTAPGPGAIFGPHVRGWNHDGAAIAPMTKVNFQAFASASYGASAAGSDADGDGWAEIVAAIGPGPTFTADVAGFNLDAGALGALGGYTATVAGGTLHGASFPRSGDADGSGDGEVSSGAGPDPAAAAAVVVVDYTGSAAVVGPQILAFSTTYGIKAAPADLGY